MAVNARFCRGHHCRRVPADSSLLWNLVCEAKADWRHEPNSSLSTRKFSAVLLARHTGALDRVLLIQVDVEVDGDRGRSRCPLLLDCSLELPAELCAQTNTVDIRIRNGVHRILHSEDQRTAWKNMLSVALDADCNPALRFPDARGSGLLTARYRCTYERQHYLLLGTNMTCRRACECAQMSQVLDAAAVYVCQQSFAPIARSCHAIMLMTASCSSWICQWGDWAASCSRPASLARIMSSVVLDEADTSSCTRAQSI